MKLALVQKVGGTVQFNISGESSAEDVFLKIIADMKFSGVDIEDDGTMSINFKTKERQ